MLKRCKLLSISLMIMVNISLASEPCLQLGLGSGYQAVQDLNTSSLVWKANGPTGHLMWMNTMRSGYRYQLELSAASVNFKSTDNYFSLSSSTVIGIMTRFLKPIPLGVSTTFLVGAGFSSPVLSIRHSNLWSMTTAMEASADLTANAGMEFKKGKWEADFMMDLPIASLAMVQDYNASGNHVIRFASFHNSFQLFAHLGCYYALNETIKLGLDARYVQRVFHVIKDVDSRIYGLDLVCRMTW